MGCCIINMKLFLVETDTGNQLPYGINVNTEKAV